MKISITRCMTPCVPARTCCGFVKSAASFFRIEHIFMLWIEAADYFETSVNFCQLRINVMAFPRSNEAQCHCDSCGLRHPDIFSTLLPTVARICL